MQEIEWILSTFWITAAFYAMPIQSLRWQQQGGPSPRLSRIDEHSSLEEWLMSVF